MNDDTDICRLYLITPDRIEIEKFVTLLDSVLGAGDVAALQLRLKDASDGEIVAAARALLPVCHDHDTLLIVNDRPDLAAQAGADGVHIGQDDADYETARSLVGEDGVVGVTCHDSRHLAMTAGEQGADYIAFGAFFPTTTKVPKASADVDILAWSSGLLDVPCVAIGGITIKNAAPLIQAGAHFLAVSAGVWQHPEGPDAAVRGFNEVIAECSRDA